MNKRMLAAGFTAAGLSLASFAGVAAADPPADHRSCPEGWTLQPVPDGDVYDKNNDGFICTKPVEGNGNSGQRQGSEPFHVPGHNHKDNNNPPPAP